MGQSYQGGDHLGFTGKPPPLQGLGAGGVCTHPSHICSKMGGSGECVWSLIGSLHQTMAVVTRHAAASISSLDQNTTTDSITANNSTPLGCTCPILTHSSTTFSSCKEPASNRVPLPLVIVRTYIWLSRSGSSPRIWSWATKVVVVDVMDILGCRNKLIYWGKMGERSAVMLREICWLSQLLHETPSTGYSEL